MQKLANDIAEQRNKILDDFFKAYLSSLDEKYFMKLKNEDFKRLILVHEIKSPIEHHYYFKLKTGKIGKINIDKK